MNEMNETKQKEAELEIKYWKKRTLSLHQKLQKLEEKRNNWSNQKQVSIKPSFFLL